MNISDQDVTIITVKPINLYIVNLPCIETLKFSIIPLMKIVLHSGTVKYSSSHFLGNN